MGIKDYYFLLGLPRFAPLEDAKTAYHKLAAQYHPDKVGNLGPQAQEEANAKMLELNEAMAVLSDPARRQEYHQLLDLIPERPLQPPPKPKPPPPPPRTGTPTPEPVAAAGPPAASSQPLPPLEEPAEKHELVMEQQIRGLKISIRNLPLKWKEKKLRGWQWALEYKDMRRNILVANRYQENLSRLSISSVVNAINALADDRRRALNPTAVFAVISYDRLMDARDVQAQLRSLGGRRGWFKNVWPLAVLYDNKSQSATVFGSPGDDEEARRVVSFFAHTGRSQI